MMLADSETPFSPLEDSETHAEPACVPQPEPSAEFRYPEDIRTPWGWPDVWAFLSLAVFSLFVFQGLAVLFAPFFHLPHLTPGQLRHPKPSVAVYFISVQMIHDGFLIAYLFVRIRAGLGQPFWSALRWRWFGWGNLSRALLCTTCIASGFVLSIMISLASAGLGKPQRLPIEAFFENRQTALLLMLMSILAAPLVEEIVFRGFLYPVLARSAGVTFGVLITGTLFGLLHYWQLRGGWGQIGLLIIVGIVLTYVRAAARSVLASYLVHLSYNFFLAAAFIVATGGLRHMPAGI